MNDLQSLFKFDGIINFSAILKLFLIYSGSISLMTLIIYGVDKIRAKREKWRIPEKVLIELAFLGGAVGAAFGMLLFHHKVRKTKFRVCVPIALILWTAAVIGLYLIRDRSFDWAAVL